LILTTASAFAADQPFEEGIYYGEKYHDYGAVPSMLNFGSAGKLSPGESLYDAKTITVKKISASALASSLKNTTYYCYAKWQYAMSFPAYTIDAMLVMTAPDGLYYATYQTWELTDISRRTICSWFFDVTDALQRCLDDHDGTFERGEYSFSMFFNNMAFRVAKVKVT
jgi:hypothetical protein